MAYKRFKVQLNVDIDIDDEYEDEGLTPEGIVEMLEGQSYLGVTAIARSLENANYGCFTGFNVTAEFVGPSDEVNSDADKVSL